MYYPSQNDINLLFQKNKKYSVKLYLLNKDMQIVDEIQGDLISGDISIDSMSNIRRVANLAFVIKNKTWFIDETSKIWIDKFVDIKIGAYFNKTESILWYNLGIYIFNENEFIYNSYSRTINISCVDMMAHLTGLFGGTLRGLKTMIPRNSIVVDVIKDIITQLGYFSKFIITENSNEEYRNIPYDINFPTGVSVYDILKKISDLFPATEFFIDTDGTFIWQTIPTAINDPVIMNNDIIGNLIIDESISKDFSQICNAVEVWGANGISSRLVLVDALPDALNEAYNYKVDINSPFTINKLKQEIWKVYSGPEYDKIYSTELTLDRCKYEMFLNTSVQNSINLTCILIPWIEPNQKFEYKNKIDGVSQQLITKKINLNLTTGIASLQCIKFYPLYSWL